MCRGAFLRVELGIKPLSATDGTADGYLPQVPQRSRRDLHPHWSGAS